MKRLNPMGSLFGFILTILLFTGLGISLWYNRGLAFNPGPVTAISKEGIKLKGFASHSEFEKKCSLCHEPLKTDLANKCKECHVEIDQQLQTGQGVHSRIADENDCASCHAEHRGRRFNPTQASYHLFDHSTTKFSLIWHQENYDATPMQCNACHKNDDLGVMSNQVCLDCHGKYGDNITLTHTQDFGSDCLNCHEGSDRMKNFDHSQTGFLLKAKHTQLKCTDCHKSSNLKETPMNCSDCHINPTMHQGLFVQTCDTCHTPEGWSPALFENQSFSHLESAGFSLNLHDVDFSNQVMTCSTCHPTDLKTLDIQTCIDCHGQNDQLFMADHVNQFGMGCIACHDGIDRLSNFEHANFFILEGKHLSIECSDCHVEKVFRETPKECWQCHAEPEVHVGVFGLKCFYCHVSEGWSPANLLQHRFPLNHGLDDTNIQQECKVCHGVNFVEYTCYSCHEHQLDEILKSHQAEGIADQDIPACINCHPDVTLDENQANP